METRMIRHKLFGKESLPLVVKAMDAYTLRHKVNSDNLANVSTDGYLRKRVSFEEDLRREINSSNTAVGVRTHENHIQIGSSRIGEMEVQFELEENQEPVNGINNVDIDMEMAELAQNSIRYSLMVSFLNKKLGDIAKAISEGS